jgi:enoyl-CoA hydratase/carnithine racemase
LASIAAIEGHAPAAGCMLALSCDYRIMSETEDKHAPTIALLSSTDSERDFIGCC